ncbi:MULTISPECIES: phage BR0599 family protein [unclassified Sphingopyxis]|uniref:phage BR0599 family protein n=1 Tax=unclassified Sphingopyxis TaxID=2614943 RepID=UPI0028577ACB|nr:MULTISPECIES: phage BR0599 family protein [unclassified Sphingopyxis]MDR7062011.1 putative phage protein (TIGR02218 family) [Sphingopyxis sp. BE235]MDR7182469.1 putative phage protein (TIGR02218 family) [Sphingopyxis sp. BE249]
MSFDNFEISNYGGRPVYFYEFRWGNSEWFYTSADRPLMLGTQEYQPVPISDDGITSGAASPGEFKINCAANLPVVGLFRGTPPSEKVRVTALRKHIDDPETKVIFTGKIDNVKRPNGGAEASLICSSGKQRRGGLRLTWSRTCPHILYDGQCRLVRALFAEPAIIGSITGNSFTVEAAPHASLGWFDGGIIEWDADGLGTLEMRAIERGTSTTTFLMFGRTDGLVVGQAVAMYPGCDRLPTTCNSKFNNLVNFGGITQQPGESPFGQNIF